MAGVNFNPLKIYAPVDFPVSRGTPMLSHLVRWDHSTTWNVPKAEMFINGGAGGKAQCAFEIDASPESDDHYLVRCHRCLLNSEKLLEK